MGKTKKQSENSACATLFNYVYYSNIEGIARTQSPTNKNDAVELSTFGIITGVNLTEVQWKGLTLGEPPS